MSTRSGYILVPSVVSHQGPAVLVVGNQDQESAVSVAGNQDQGPADFL